MANGTPNRSWVYWAEYHGFNRFDCWHHKGVGNQTFNYDLFLPWHRAYLHRFEQVALAANPKATLQWWDWTSPASHQSGIPASFTAAGPLSSGPVPTGLRTSPPGTQRQPGQSGVAADHADDRRHPRPVELRGLHEPAAGPTRLRPRVDGRRHGRSGDLGVRPDLLVAPLHDRPPLWYLWQVKHGVDNIPPSYLNRPLAPWALTVKDVLDIGPLGYSYGLSRVLIPVEAFTPVALLTPPGDPAPRTGG